MLILLLISKILAYQSITTTASTNSTAVNLQSKSYCNCDFLIGACDLNCCCDPDCTASQISAFVTCSNSYLNQICVKSWIITFFNKIEFDGTGVAVIPSTSSNLKCFQSDYLSNSISYKSPQTDITSQVNIYYHNETQILFTSAKLPSAKSDQTSINALNLRSLIDPTNGYILHADSNGYCSKIYPIQKYTPVIKSWCFFQSNVNLNLGLSAYFTTAGTSTGYGGVNYAFTYDAKSGTISNTYTQTQDATLLSSQYGYTTLTFNDQNMAFFDGIPGYQIGYYVQGFINTSSINIDAGGYKVYNGKVNRQTSQCSLTAQGVDPTQYDSLRFGRNTQISCNLPSTCNGTLNLANYQIFQSFPYAANGSFSLASIPFYQLDGTSIYQNDWIQSALISLNQTSTSCATLTNTQVVLIYYNKYGMKNSAKYYISRVEVGWLNDKSYANSAVTLKVKIKFVNMGFADVDDTQVPDPPFIPQLPSDILYPVWYETRAIILGILAIVFLL